MGDEPGRVVRIVDARVDRLLDRLGSLYETRDAAEQVCAQTAKAITATLLELDEARLEAAQLPLPVTVAARGR